MSYTIPDYVDTQEQAVLALASVIADEDKSALGDGSVNKALDVLADVLAKQDVQVPQTNAGAILALADYVSGGGGGDVDLGTVNCVYCDYIAAKAGDEVSGPSVFAVKVGDTVAAENDSLIKKVAAGITAVASAAMDQPEDGKTYTTVARTCTVDMDTFKYATVSQPIDLAITTSIIDDEIISEFIMPELGNGVSLLLSVVEAD